MGGGRGQFSNIEEENSQTLTLYIIYCYFSMVAAAGHLVVQVFNFVLYFMVIYFVQFMLLIIIFMLYYCK